MQIKKHCQITYPFVWVCICDVSSSAVSVSFNNRLNPVFFGLFAGLGSSPSSVSKGKIDTGTIASVSWLKAFELFEGLFRKISFQKFIYDRLTSKIQTFDRDLTDIQATTSSNDRIVSNLPAKPDQSDAANANLTRVRGLSSSVKRDKYFWRSLGAFWAI